MALGGGRPEAERLSVRDGGRGGRRQWMGGRFSPEGLFQPETHLLWDLFPGEPAWLSPSDPRGASGVPAPPAPKSLRWAPLPFRPRGPCSRSVPPESPPSSALTPGMQSRGGAGLSLGPALSLVRSGGLTSHTAVAGAWVLSCVKPTRPLSSKTPEQFMRRRANHHRA